MGPRKFGNAGELRPLQKQPPYQPLGITLNHCRTKIYSKVTETAEGVTCRKMRGSARQYHPAGGSGRGFDLFVAAQLPVQGRWVDPQHLSRPGLVATFRLQHVHNIRPFDDVEGRIDVAPFRDQRLLAPLGDSFGQRGRFDGVAASQDPGVLQGILQLTDVAGPVVHHDRVERVGGECLRLGAMVRGEPLHE